MLGHIFTATAFTIIELSMTNYVFLISFELFGAKILINWQGPYIRRYTNESRRY